jgi:hypothetical protein
MGATGGRTPPSKATVLLLMTCVLSAIWAAAMLTPFGRVGYYFFWAYSEFYMGVISLVSLSITIMIGLVATDRLVLSIRQRVLLQSAHRTTGVIAVTALVIHVWTKLMESHIRVIDIVIPFLAPYNRAFIGLGTLSGWIMIMVMWTGLARARFIGRGKPWMWRSVHAISYLMWPIALVHGLSAGRPAATWVVVSYVICILLVLVGLAVRLSVSLNRRKDFSSSSTGAIKPVGSLVPTSAPSPKKRASSRREPLPVEARVIADRGNAPAAVLDPWVPAAPPVSPAPAAPAPRASYEDDYRAARPARSARYADEDDRAPRARRYDDEPAPRQRRAEPVDRYDEPTRPMSRRDDDRHRYAADEEPAARRRRAVDEDYDDESLTRARRVVEENRAARYDDEDEPRPRRGRRYAEDDEPASRARRHAEEEPDPRSRRYADEYDDMPRRQRSQDARSLGAHSGEFMTGELRMDRTGEFRMDDGPASPRSRRHIEDDAPTPRSRRGERGDVDRADSGRHSRSEFVDLAEPADPWGASADANYVPPDETPTLVDMASRRARRATAAPQDAGRGQTSRGARRTRSRADADMSDDRYWRQLRGEAQ